VRWGLRISIFKKFPGNAGTYVPKTTLYEPRTRREYKQNKEEE
jgi:hypothetical protein